MLASKNKNNKFKKSVAVQNSLHILEFSGGIFNCLYILWQPMINFKCMYQATTLVLPVLPLSLLLLSCYCYCGKPEQAPHWSWQRPRAQNNGIYMYLGLYHLPCICCTLVHEIHVHPEILRVFRYIDVLMCVIYDWTACMDDWSYLCMLWRLSMKTGRWMCRHMV